MGPGGGCTERTCCPRHPDLPRTFQNCPEPPRTTQTCPEPPRATQRRPEPPSTAESRSEPLGHPHGEAARGWGGPVRGAAPGLGSPGRVREPVGRQRSPQARLMEDGIWLHCFGVKYREGRRTSAHVLVPAGARGHVLGVGNGAAAGQLPASGTFYPDRWQRVTATERKHAEQRPGCLSQSARSGATQPRTCALRSPPTEHRQRRAPGDTASVPPVGSQAHVSPRPQQWDACWGDVLGVPPPGPRFLPLRSGLSSESRCGSAGLPVRVWGWGGPKPVAPVHVAARTACRLPGHGVRPTVPAQPHGCLRGDGDTEPVSLSQTPGNDKEPGVGAGRGGGR